MLLAVGLLAACPAPQPVDLGGVALELWQVPGPGEAPFLDDADEVTVVVTIDGTTTSHPLSGSATAAIETAPEGARVELLLRASGPFGEAVARPAPFEVTPDAQTVVRRAVLARPGLTMLHERAPDGRQRAAACGDGEGGALIVGGDEGAALSFGSFHIDPADETVGEGPGLLERRTQASCVLVGDDVWLLGGCTLAGDPVATLERSEVQGGPFAVAGDAPPAGAGCLSAIAPASDGFIVLAGATLQRRDTEGAVLDEVALPEAHYGGSTAEHPAGGVVVVGGTADTDGAQMVSAGRWWRDSGEVETLAGLGTGALVTEGEGELLALTDDGRFVALTAAGGIDERLAASLVTLGAGLPVAMAPSAGGGAWVLTDAGDAAYALTSAGGTDRVDLTPARPGARLVAGPGGSTWLVGGAAGALLLQPE